jgi:zinc transport system permease protein
MLELFQYSFVLRGLQAGLIIAVIAPLIGIFLILRRYSLIADTLAHVSLAGVAIGLLFGLNPVVTAVFTAALSSAAIERLRLSKRVYGESALALFLSGSLALAVVLISAGGGFNANIFNYLFGSIITVTTFDIALIGGLGIVIIALIAAFYKELVYVTFDEEAAQVSGIPARLINLILIVLAALTVALAIPVIGVLLISALVVIPVLAALQLRKSFVTTIVWAEIFSVFSVVAGIIASYYLDLATGGTIVLIAVAIFLGAFFIKSGK